MNFVWQDCLNGEFVRVGPNPKFAPVAGYHWYFILFMTYFHQWLLLFLQFFPFPTPKQIESLTVPLQKEFIILVHPLLIKRFCLELPVLNSALLPIYAGLMEMGTSLAVSTIQLRVHIKFSRIILKKKCH